MTVPRRRSVPPVTYPKLPCIGGPLDGRVVSELDLPLGAAVKIRTPTHWRYDAYVRARQNGRDVWVWTEVPVVL